MLDVVLQRERAMRTGMGAIVLALTACTGSPRDAAAPPPTPHPTDDATVANRVASSGEVPEPLPSPRPRVDVMLSSSGGSLGFMRAYDGLSVYYRCDDRLPFRAVLEACGETPLLSWQEAGGARLERIERGEADDPAGGDAPIERHFQSWKGTVDFRPTSINVAADGRFLLTGVDEESALVVEYAIEDDPALRMVPCGEPIRFPAIGVVADAAVLPDADRVLIALDRQRALLWRIDVAHRESTVIADAKRLPMLAVMERIEVSRPRTEPRAVCYLLTDQAPYVDTLSEDDRTLQLWDDDGDGSIDRVEEWPR